MTIHNKQVPAAPRKKRNRPNSTFYSANRRGVDLFNTSHRSSSQSSNQSNQLSSSHSSLLSDEFPPESYITPVAVRTRHDENNPTLLNAPARPVKQQRTCNILFNSVFSTPNESETYSLISSGETSNSQLSQPLMSSSHIVENSALSDITLIKMNRGNSFGNLSSSSGSTSAPDTDADSDKSENADQEQRFTL